MVFMVVDSIWPREADESTIPLAIVAAAWIVS
jgi:hypothetical protein